MPQDPKLTIKDIIYSLILAKIFSLVAKLYAVACAIWSECGSLTVRQGCKWRLVKSMQPRNLDYTIFLIYFSCWAERRAPSCCEVPEMFCGLRLKSIWRTVTLCSLDYTLSDMHCHILNELFTGFPWRRMKSELYESETARNIYTLIIFCVGC